MTLFPSGLHEELALCRNALADLEVEADRAWKDKNYAAAFEIRKEHWTLQQHVTKLEQETT